MENPFQLRRAVIEEVRDETPNTKTYTLRPLDGGFVFKPGQFVMLSLPGYGEAPISISSNPWEQERFELTVRRVGAVTGALFHLDEGNEVEFRGPYGRGWPLEEVEGRRLLIVAGGTGLCTLRSVILAYLNGHVSLRGVELLYGARTPGDLLYKGELEEWAGSSRLRVLLTVDVVPEGEEWEKGVGVVTTLFEEMETGPEDSAAFICGPEVMMKFAVKGLLERGFDPRDLYCSLERRMRCGIGLCGHCQIGSRYVCLDGPVFSYQELRHLPDHEVRA